MLSYFLRTFFGEISVSDFFVGNFYDVFFASSPQDFSGTLEVLFGANINTN